MYLLLKTAYINYASTLLPVGISTQWSLMAAYVSFNKKFAEYDRFPCQNFPKSNGYFIK